MAMQNGNSNFACDIMSRVWIEEQHSHTTLASDGTIGDIQLSIKTIKKEVSGTLTPANLSSRPYS